VLKKMGADKQQISAGVEPVLPEPVCARDA